MQSFEELSRELARRGKAEQLRALADSAAGREEAPSACADRVVHTSISTARNRVSILLQNTCFIGSFLLHIPTCHHIISCLAFAINYSLFRPVCPASWHR